MHCCRKVADRATEQKVQFLTRWQLTGLSSQVNNNELISTHTITSIPDRRLAKLRLP